MRYRRVHPPTRSILPRGAFPVRCVGREIARWQAFAKAPGGEGKEAEASGAESCGG